MKHSREIFIGTSNYMLHELFLDTETSDNVIKLSGCIIQGGSNMNGTVTGLFTHKSVPVIFEPPCITVAKTWVKLTLWTWNWTFKQ